MSYTEATGTGSGWPERKPFSGLPTAQAERILDALTSAFAEVSFPDDGTRSPADQPHLPHQPSSTTSDLTY